MTGNTLAAGDIAAGDIAVEDIGDPATAPPPRTVPSYEEMVSRNRGLVSPAEQSSLQRATMLVAGCGSIGGAVVEPLVRLGAGHLILAEPDVYEAHNLNRQAATVADIGLNKADVLARSARQVNPRCRAEVVTEGITAQNVHRLVARAALVFDGVDVTAREALLAKYRLHEAAQKLRVPVISGYDIAGTQLVMVYDYRRAQPPLGGKVTEHDLLTLEPMRFLARVVPLRALPMEIFPVLEQRLREPDAPFPQLVYSARMFGVLASRLAIDVLAGRRVRHRIVVDVHHLTRPLPRRLIAHAARLRALARLLPAATRARH